MGISHEGLLTSLEESFPDKVKEAGELYPKIEPLVREEYLFELCAGDEGLIELLEDMLENFYRYTRDVCEQEALKENLQDNLEEIKERDVMRTSAHNAMIESVNILIRNLRERGIDTTWAAKLDKNDRSGYARFAFQMTFLDILKRHHDQSYGG